MSQHDIIILEENEISVMKKKNIINLIKYHINNDDKDFRNEAYEVARVFDIEGDGELSRYIMALLSGTNTFTPQSLNGLSDYFVPIDEPSKTFKLPLSIERDIIGIINAVRRKANVNKFLFVGDSGTGKTEATKQIARILGRKLFSVRFDRIVDSKLGQTSKNLVQVFDDINALKNPEELIILFDEIDAIALDRINSNDLREMGRVTSTLLRELDSLNHRVLLIATTNLYAMFDKALIRRFDFVVDFNRYGKEDLVEIANALLKMELETYSESKPDSRLINKIFNLCDRLPSPGDLKNIIRSSVAFSDLEGSRGYLPKIYEILTGHKINENLKDMQELGFTTREIEKLTGKSKSTVSRSINNE